MLPPDPCVLVIEDSQEHALLVRSAVRLAFPTLDVRVAGDGHEGIAYLSHEPPFHDRNSHPFPDLILLDLAMPRVDGFGVLEWMAGADMIHAVPVVVLTSSVKPGDEEKAIGLGAKQFHSKPDNINDLGSVVRTLVGEWLRDQVLT